MPGTAQKKRAWPEKCEVCSGPFRVPKGIEIEMMRHGTRAVGEELENERDYLLDLLREQPDELGLKVSTAKKALAAAQLYGEQRARAECAGMREGVIYNVRP